jgi:hypothetical protein
MHLLWIANDSAIFLDNFYNCHRARRNCPAQKSHHSVVGSTVSTFTFWNRSTGADHHHHRVRVAPTTPPTNMRFYYLAFLLLTAVTLFRSQRFMTELMRMKTSGSGSVVVVGEDDVNHNETRRRNYCRTIRGNAGRWVQDLEYATTHQYPVYGSYNNWHVVTQNFRPTNTTPFRWATTFKWQDDNCPVPTISIDAFCRVCYRLNLTRILLVGDSLTFQFLFSLLSLLGYPPRGRQYTFNGLLQPFHIPCSFIQHHNESSDNNRTVVEFAVTLSLYRRSPLKDWQYLQQMVDNNQTAQDEYHQFVTTNPNRTAILANTGAWMQSMDEYTEAFDALLTWIDSFGTTDNNDGNKVMAFFRPTIPGHANCTPSMGNDTTTKETYNWTDPLELHEAPYGSYQEYVAATYNQTKPYQWDLFESFNEHSKHLLAQRRATDHQQLDIRWLNVYNSSVLRRDGHVGFGDCMHYSVPGPTDWWVHFFFAMLQDAANDINDDDDDRSG